MQDRDAAAASEAIALAQKAAKERWDAYYKAHRKSSTLLSFEEFSVRNPQQSSFDTFPGPGSRRWTKVDDLLTTSPAPAGAQPGSDRSMRP